MEKRKKTYFKRPSDGKVFETLYEPCCQICGTPLAKENKYCDKCTYNIKNKENPPLMNFAFGKYLKYGEYNNDPLSNEIRKFKSDPSLCKPLSECLIHAMDNMYPSLKHLECIVPVMNNPGHGFNRLKLLGEILSERYGMVLVDCLYQKDNYPRIHTIQNPIEKRKAIRGKISCNEKFYDETVLLIDDVYTYGTTKEECTRILKLNGVTQVCSLVLGITVSKVRLNRMRKSYEK